MDAEESGGERSSASSVDFDDPTDWITAKVHEVGRAEPKTTVLTYRPRQFIARGNFGYITRILTSDRKTLALKQVNARNRVAMQEIEIMQQLTHQNLVKILYYYKERFDKNHVRVFIIMEYMSQSLVKHIVDRHEGKRPFTHVEIALILYQILRGLEHMHRRHIAHRDIKPHNVLIDVDEQLVKVCDFGSAKNLTDAKRANATYVCSRWYRAPELLLQNGQYTNKVDIWSCGCVLGELILLQPLFCGADTVDQWACIKDVLGTPSDDEMKAVGQLPSEARDHVVVGRKDLAAVFDFGAPQVVIELFEELTQYAHFSRPTAWAALAHPAFDVLRTHEIHSAYPHLFNFTSEELGYEPDINKLFQPEV